MTIGLECSIVLMIPGVGTLALTGLLVGPLVKFADLLCLPDHPDRGDLGYYQGLPCRDQMPIA